MPLLTERNLASNMQSTFQTLRFLVLLLGLGEAQCVFQYAADQARHLLHCHVLRTSQAAVCTDVSVQKPEIRGLVQELAVLRPVSVKEARGARQGVELPAHVTRDVILLGGAGEEEDET
jgi:hypothetical protein